MKLGPFEFNLRELSGATGDFGTIFPLVIGYVVVCGVNPAGILVSMGLVCIITGIVYKLPLPIEPMKVLAVVAISQGWSSSMVSASAFAMGLIWLIFGVTGIMGWVTQVTPKIVVRSLQVALGILLVMQSIKMLSQWWVIGIISVLVILLLRQNRYVPGAIAAILLGIGIMLFQGKLHGGITVGFTLPQMTRFTGTEVWQALLLAGFAQIPLTATNAVISTSSLISKFWPGTYVGEKRLSLSMGIINFFTIFFGGMPMCHGAGGLAGKYYFGARTGGANIMEGAIYIILGLFFASSFASLFNQFPMAIIGAMMFLIGFELIKFVRDIDIQKDVGVLLVTVAVSLLFNMAYGYLAGMLLYYSYRMYLKKTGRCTCQEEIIFPKEEKKKDVHIQEKGIY